PRDGEWSFWSPFHVYDSPPVAPAASTLSTPPAPRICAFRVKAAIMRSSAGENPVSAAAASLAGGSSASRWPAVAGPGVSAWSAGLSALQRATAYGQRV